MQRNCSPSARMHRCSSPCTSFPSEVYPYWDRVSDSNGPLTVALTLLSSPSIHALRHMRAIRKGLTAGLRESVDWATSTTSTGSSTGLSGLAPLDDVSVGGGGSLPWEEDTDETASEHCVVQLTHATGLAWAPAAGGGACFAFCVGDAAGQPKGRRGVTLPHDKAPLSPTWNWCVPLQSFLSVLPVNARTHAQPHLSAPRYTGSTRDLCVRAAPGDVLFVELYEDASCSTGCLATAHVALDRLPLDSQPVSLPLRRCCDPRTCVGGASGSVTVRRLPWRREWYTQKTLFFVRHGQSRWNDAQKSRRIDAMMAFDHPLTRAGADQALALRERWRAAQQQQLTQPPRPLHHTQAQAQMQMQQAGVSNGFALEDAFAEFCSATPSPAAGQQTAPPAQNVPVTGSDADDDSQWVAQFLEATFFASSPLTRALQTALLALHGHPGLEVSDTGAGGCRLSLLRCMREIKGVGSLDSVGKCIGGPDMLARCDKMLREELPPGLCDDLFTKCCATPVDYNDTAGAEWWTPADDLDTDADVTLRLADALACLQFAPGHSAVLVGHSLLFRDLVRRLTLTSSRAFAGVSPAAASLCAQMCDAKLSNAGCCALRLAWDRNGQARIIDARLMFGSTLAMER